MIPSHSFDECNIRKKRNVILATEAGKRFPKNNDTMNISELGWKVHVFLDFKHIADNQWIILREQDW